MTEKSENATVTEQHPSTKSLTVKPLEWARSKFKRVFRVGRGYISSSVPPHDSLTKEDPQSYPIYYEAEYRVRQVYERIERFDEISEEEYQENFEIIRKASGLFSDAIRIEEESNAALRVVNNFVEFDHQPARQLGVQIIADNFLSIQRQINEVKEYFQIDFLNAASKLVKYGDERQKTWGVAFLKTHADKIPGSSPSQYLGGVYLSYEYISLMQAMMVSGDNELETIAKRRVDECLADPERFALSKADLLGKLLKVVINPETRTKTEPVLQYVYQKYSQRVEQYDFDAENLWLMWQKAHPYFPAAFAKNLGNMIRIEEQKPGVTKALFRQFGIVNFGRYPFDMLVKQFEQLDNTELPYGIILFPYGDYNAGFYKDEFISGLESGLKDRYLLRIFEVGSKIDVARKLLWLNQRYGQQHKISFAIIGGHGTTDSIQFDDQNPGQALSAEDLRGRGTQRASQFFGDNPSIILLSCETGAEAGIGEKIADILGAKVIAPTEPTGGGGIWAKEVDGELEFVVKFDSANAYRTISGKK